MNDLQVVHLFPAVLRFDRLETRNSIGSSGWSDIIFACFLGFLCGIEEMEVVGDGNVNLKQSGDGERDALNTNNPRSKQVQTVQFSRVRRRRDTVLELPQSSSALDHSDLRYISLDKKAPRMSSASPKIKSLAQGGPSKLTTILRQLNAKPRLSLQGVKSLRLTYAFRNDHFGARFLPRNSSLNRNGEEYGHFAKEDLPRIRWANPELDIQVERVNKTKEEQWKPELVVNFADNTSRTIPLANKLSTSITLELMNVAGGKSWEEHRAAAEAAGEPILPSDPSLPQPSPLKKTAAAAQGLPSFAEFKKTHPEAGKPKPVTTTAPTKEKKDAAPLAGAFASAAAAAAPPS
ncbi:hypothetical protein D9611_006972 [Ephemerocybe angulata]|uniref:Ribosomal protein/NADH dehydrogenase domain-containing protein n=1 Tax=Ephemerocybe angulata TaxID=980116 RepID=A0A8H5EVJ9_9AGAR|nr:hypothetical protein D9611_006972 [Tulosesus angulatus]